MDDKEETKQILMAAITLGFTYSDGILSCTLDQLIQFSAEVANATANQIMEAFANKQDI